MWGGSPTVWTTIEWMVERAVMGEAVDTAIVTGGSIVVAFVTAGFAFLGVMIQKARTENRADHDTTNDTLNRIERLVKAHGRRLRAQEKRLKALEKAEGIRPPGPLPARGRRAPSKPE